MKVTDLRDLSEQELEQRIVDAQRRLVDVRMKVSVGDDTENPLQMRTIRRDIARMKTLLKEREAKVS